MATNDQNLDNKHVFGQLKFDSEVSDVLDYFRTERLFCDGVLRSSEGGEFRIHRTVMVTCSPYFDALYRSPINDRDTSDITIPGISDSMLDCIIQYVYKRRVNVQWENVYQLIEAADQFNVSGIKDVCRNFLIKRLSFGNCISIRNIARVFYCQVLQSHTQRFLLKNFLHVSKEHEYLSLSFEDLSEVLNSDELNVRKEEEVWEAILRWIDFKPIERHKFTSELLKCVRLALMDYEYFMAKVKLNNYVDHNESCRGIVIETISCMFQLNTDNFKYSEFGWNLQKPRLPNELIFAFGGWMGNSVTNIIEVYDVKTSSWIKLTVEDLKIDLQFSLPTQVTPKEQIGPRAYHKCAVINQDIYIIGGFDGTEQLNECYKYHIHTSTWREIAPMYKQRCYVSVAVLGDIIYAMGGYDGLARQKTSERYHCDSNQWEMIAPMNFERSDAGASSLKEHIYIVGGFNGTDYLNSAECYDIKLDQWTVISRSMHSVRSGVSCIGFNGYLYVFGGFDGIERLSTAEKYDPVTNTWSTISGMCIARSNFAIVVLEDIVYIVGGHDGVGTISSVECYDVNSDQWLEPEEMASSRSALDACIISDVTNVKCFIPNRTNQLTRNDLSMHFL